MIIDTKIYEQLVDLERLINTAPKKVVRKLNMALLNIIHENMILLQDTPDNILNARYSLLLIKMENISPRVDGQCVGY